MKVRSPKQISIKALQAERESLREEWSQWRSTFERVRKYINPTRGRFERGENPNREKAVTSIIDPKCSRAMGTLVSGLSSGMTSRSRKWFRLMVATDQKNNLPEVKEWLAESERIVYRVLRKGGFYHFFEEAYTDLPTFGTFGGGLQPDFESIVKPVTFPFGTYVLGEGEEGRIEHMHREVRMPAIRALQRFGKQDTPDHIKWMVQNDQGHKAVTIQHVTGPRHGAKLGSPLAQDMPYRSIYYDETEEVVMRNSGFEVNPVIGVRWSRVSGQTYSPTWPGLVALGSAVSLQHYHLKAARAIDKVIDPPMQGPAGGQVPSHTVVRGNPGDLYTTGRSAAQGGEYRPAQEVEPVIVQLAQTMIADYRNNIDEAFFADLFLLTAMSDRREVTAREIAERHEEKLTMLGPVLESLDQELLTPVIEGVFHYCFAAGLIPEPPEALTEEEIKIDYISLLAQAQKQVQIGAIERTIGFVGTLAQIQPEALDKLNTDAAIDHFADQIGTEPDVIRSNDDVAALRKRRADAAAEEQARAEMPAMAQSAKLISEANERGDRRLDQGAGL